MNEMIIQSGSPVNTLAYSDIEGSPYSNEDLHPGTIELTTGERIDSVPMRYDWYAKKMEFKPGGQLMELTESTQIRFIMLDNQKYVPFFIPSVGGYLVELYSGNYRLYKKAIVKFAEEVPAKSGYEKPKPAQFKWSGDSFLLINDKEEIIWLSTNKKRLAKQFPGEEEKILSYIREHKIKPGKEEDIISLIKEIDSWGK